MHVMIRGIALGALIVLSAILGGCGDSSTADETAAPVVYDISVSAPRWVVPSANLPSEVQTFPSNNNVDIAFHDGRLFMAWRTAPTHFASAATRMYVVSSTDRGATWDFEHVVALGSDVREPRLLSFRGELQLIFFQAGTNPAAFEPMKMLRTKRQGLGAWGPLEVLADVGEVPWAFKVRDGRAYRTSYFGEHYGSGDVSDIRVFFTESTDGTTWTPVGGVPFVYRGGVSEVAFEFASDGTLWAVTRNEDGDDSGFGAHVCRAAATALGNWECPSQSDPERYDSPEMFRHEDDIYLVARRDIGGPYDQQHEGSLGERRGEYLLAYSRRPKRAALYQLDTTNRAVMPLFDLPGVGDTAFPSVQSTGPHSFLLANYTSPLDDPDVTWLQGQNSSRGTQLYLLDLTFVPRSGPTTTPTRTPTRPAVATPTPTPTVAPKIELGPVFADAGASLSITWPDVPGLVGMLDLGDGRIIGPTIEEYDYGASGGIFMIDGSLDIGGDPVRVSGAVARTATRAFTPLQRFLLKMPASSAAQGVIRTVIPAFYWVRGGDQFAFASDPTGTASFGFEDVVTAPITVQGDGSFATLPVAFRVQLTLDRMASGLFVGISNAVFRGHFDGEAFRNPITMDAEIAIDDVVAVLEAIAMLDRAGALEFIAELFEFDPSEPPPTGVFSGEFLVQPVSAGATN